MKINIEPSKKAVKEDRIKKNPKAVILRSDIPDDFNKVIDDCKTIDDIKEVLKAVALII